MWNNIKRFAGDRINELGNAADKLGNDLEYGAKQLRDKAVVPALDNAMEAGHVPATAGMYGRYLSGTEVPLTKMPADVRKSEQSKVDALLAQNKTKAKNPMHQARIRINSLIEQQENNGVDMKFHNMGHGNYTPDQIAKHKTLQGEMDSINKQYPNMPRKFDINADAGFATQLDDFDPNNYNTTDYKGTGMGGIREGTKYVDGTSNTLGQYSVSDGVLNDRYDFDKNNGFTTADKPMYTRDGKQLTDAGKFTHGGIIGTSDNDGLKSKLATQAGRVSQNLGLIRPGSGYDVRFDLGQR